MAQMKLVWWKWECLPEVNWIDKRGDGENGQCRNGKSVMVLSRSLRDIVLSGEVGLVSKYSSYFCLDSSLYVEKREKKRLLECVARGYSYSHRICANVRT